MRISIRHQLSITPAPGTAHAVLQVLLTPQSGPTQRIDSWNMEMAGISPEGLFTDAFGNAAHLVNQSRPEGPLMIMVTGSVDTTDTHGVLGRPGGEPVPALYKRITGLTRAPAALYGRFRGSKESRLDILHALMARVGEALGAAPAQAQMQANGAQSQTTSTSALPQASDLVHGFIGACRTLDIPARYVTGYLCDAGQESNALHAWAEAYDEGLGWIGFDPVLQLCPTDRHIRLAVGLDAVGAQPVRLVPAGDIRTVALCVEAI